jgi:aldehyde dehydrogenase (NAD(P)+)
MINEPSTEAAALDVRPELDAIVATLQAGERRWAATTLAERAAVLDRVQAAVGAEAEEWVRTASRIKGLQDSSPLVGEEWTCGPYATLMAVAALARTLRVMDAGKGPLDGVRLGRAPGSRVTVPVLPSTPYEKLLLHGFSAQVWMPPGVSADEVRGRAGLGARRPRETGGVGLVLGAGNITSIAPLDVLYELIAHNRVVLLKINPVLDELKPVFERALKPLIDLDAVRVVSGGGDVGGYLAHHEGIAHVHITGSLGTHDAVAFGTGPQGRARKAAGTPLLDKPMTSELGGVSPVIVVPGAWSRRDLRMQAEHIATQRLHNSGHNCVGTQLVILSADWPQRAAFLDALRTAMDEAPARPTWYPGSVERVNTAADAYPDAELRGCEGERLLITLDGEEEAGPLESTEYFAPVLGVLALPGTGLEFLTSAIRRANRELVGTLGANIVISPATQRSFGPAFEEALADLRYGTIAVNTWTGIGFLTATAPWGAFPGHTVEDAESGIGVVHNAMLIDGPERTVLRGPFRPFPRSFAGGEFALFPKPPWFATARTAATTGRRLTRFASKPSWSRLPPVFTSAFRA